MKGEQQDLAAQAIIQRLAVGLRPLIQKEIDRCAGDVRQLRFLFEAVWENRNHGFCCDHTTTEDGNTDDSCVSFCVGQAITKRHMDCLTMMLFLEALPEELRDEILEYRDSTGKR